MPFRSIPQQTMSPAIQGHEGSRPVVCRHCSTPAPLSNACKWRVPATMTNVSDNAAWGMASANIQRTPHTSSNRRRPSPRSSEPTGASSAHFCQARNASSCSPAFSWRSARCRQAAPSAGVLSRTKRLKRAVLVGLGADATNLLSFRRAASDCSVTSAVRNAYNEDPDEV